MNGKKARALRNLAVDRKMYRALKRAEKADQGQRPAPLVVRVRKPKRAIKPTWPATLDQKRQQRPMIVERPARHLFDNATSEQRRKEIRAAFNALPKHECDSAAVTGRHWAL